MIRVLVVEDEQHLADGLRFNLEAEGYQVQVAETGEAALDLVITEPSLVDVVVLDVMLPGKDGFDVCRELRRAGLKTPILMLTAKAREAEKVMGLELGADDYVTKPFGYKHLLSRIQTVLHAAPRLRQFRDVPRTLRPRPSPLAF